MNINILASSQIVFVSLEGEGVEFQYKRNISNYQSIYLHNAHTTECPYLPCCDFNSFQNSNMPLNKFDNRFEGIS